MAAFLTSKPVVKHKEDHEHLELHGFRRRKSRKVSCAAQDCLERLTVLVACGSTATKRYIRFIGMYRWETNIRMAAILGFVGAGGLGQMLYFELSLFHLPRACTVIAAMLARAALVDAASAILRRGGVVTN